MEAPGDRFCVGVQWHPETAADVGLLAGLVRAAAAYATAMTADDPRQRPPVPHRAQASSAAIALGADYVEFDVQRCARRLARALPRPRSTSPPPGTLTYARGARPACAGSRSGLHLDLKVQRRRGRRSWRRAVDRLGADRAARHHAGRRRRHARSATGPIAAGPRPPGRAVPGPWACATSRCCTRSGSGSPSSSRASATADVAGEPRGRAPLAGPAAGAPVRPHAAGSRCWCGPSTPRTRCAYWLRPGPRLAGDHQPTRGRARACGT